MAQSFDNQYQLTLPEIESLGLVREDGGGSAVVKARTTSIGPRTQPLMRTEVVRNSVNKLATLAPPVRSVAGGNQAGPGIAATGKSKATPRLERISPECIRPNQFLTREEAYWDGTDFQDFKADIRASQGNIQPIKVRPVIGADKTEYEVVFGNRRHRACLDLNLRVYAIVEELSDLELFTQAVRENTRRKDCSAYARGVQFMRALDIGLINEDQDWNELFGVDRSMVYKLVKLARLPRRVVQAFDCSSQLQTRWGPGLARAVKHEEDELFKRVAEVEQWPVPRNPKLVLEHLLPKPQSASAAVEDEVRLEKQGRTLATLTIPHAAKGEGIVVEFAAGAIDPKILERTLRQLLNINEANGNVVS